MELGTIVAIHKSNAARAIQRLPIVSLDNAVGEFYLTAS
jgi:hypothetical protein